MTVIWGAIIFPTHKFVSVAEEGPDSCPSSVAKRDDLIVPQLFYCPSSAYTQLFSDSRMFDVKYCSNENCLRLF